MEMELEIAKRAAAGAGRILMEHYGSVESEYKADGSHVTVADREAEDLIKSVLSSEFPSYSFLGEETGMDDRKSDMVWVVDPLDGTGNYSMKNPLFNTSIALVKNGEPVLGVVYCPVQDEMFSAVKGRGAFLNGVRIHVSSLSVLGKARIAFCHGKGPDDVRRVARIFSEFKTVNDVFRQMGSSELELAYVAAGRLDGFMNIGMKPWDVAAGAVIVSEAGGAVTDIEGGRFSLKSRDILACNAGIQKAMLGVLSKAIRS